MLFTREKDAFYKSGSKQLITSHEIFYRVGFRLNLGIGSKLIFLRQLDQW